MAKRISIKRAWVDKDGDLQIKEKYNLSNIVARSTDKLVLGSDFMIFVDDECVFCSIDEFNPEQS